jgi:hypothetical protein
MVMLRVTAMAASLLRRFDAVTLSRCQPTFTSAWKSTKIRAKRLIIATGVRDALPPVPGLAERWGRSVFHCPYCHGYKPWWRATTRWPPWDDRPSAMTWRPTCNWCCQTR